MNHQQILDEIRKGKSVSIRYNEDAWSGDTIPTYAQEAADAAKFFGNNHREVEIIAINQEGWGGIKFAPRSAKREQQKEVDALREHLYKSDRPKWRSFMKLADWGALEDVSVERAKTLVEIHECWNEISYSIYEGLCEKHYPKHGHIPFTPDGGVSQYEYDATALRKKCLEEFGKKVDTFFKGYFLAALKGEAPARFPFDKRSIEEISLEQVERTLSYQYGTFIR